MELKDQLITTIEAKRREYQAKKREKFRVASRRYSRLFASIIVIGIFCFILPIGLGIGKTPQLVFQEAGQWQIAADSPGVTLILRPNATGTANQLPVTGAGANWEAVDEEASDGDDSYVGGTIGKNNTFYDLYNLPNSNLTGSINSVTVYINVRSANKDGIARTVIKTEGEEKRGSDVSLPSAGAYAVTSTSYATNTYTGSAWTWDEVNALEVGVELSEQVNSNLSDLRCTQVWAVVDYNAPVLDQKHYRWRDDTIGLNTSSTASWLADEDTAWTTTTKNTITRLRVEIANTGSAQATSTQYQLEYAVKNGATCGDDETFAAVPTTTASAPFVMATSTQATYTDDATITALFLTAATGTSATTTGKAVEYPSNKTSGFDLATSTYTEFEYALKATDNATSNHYCFRLTNNGATANFTYSKYPELDLPPDFSVTSSDISFDPNNPLANGDVTITAVIHNDGGNYDIANYDPVLTDEHWDESDGAVGSAHYAIHTDEFLAQSFTPQENFKLSKISLNIAAVGTCGTLTITIREDNGNAPTGAVLATSTRTECTPTTYQWTDFTFSNNPSLNKDQKYWIRADGTGADTSNDWAWTEDEDTSTDYPRGNGAYNSGDDTSWTNDPATSDYWFKVYKNEKNLYVNFFDGDPDSGGTQINGTTTITSFASGATTTASTTWTPSTAGNHDIYVVIDRNNEIAESDESNNKDYSTIYVEPINLNQNHYCWRDDSTALNTSGGWLAATDTAWAADTKNTVTRLRMEIANTGTAQATGTQYQLEYAVKNGATCGDDETFAAVPTTTASAPFVMATSTQATYTDDATITALFLTAATGTSATTTGKAVEYPSNKTSAFDLATSTYTEFEYALKATDNATSSFYCFRLTNNNSTSTFTYSEYPEINFPNIDQTHYRWRNDNGGEGALGWYDSSWSYRKSILIYNSTSTLTDYQVKVELTPSNFDYSKASSTLADLRFTDSGGTTTLSYWIETASTTATSTIWVKVLSLSGNSITTIYIYYGNPSASSASNATATFIFYDDFPGSSVDSSKWEAYNGTEAGKSGTCSISVSNSRVDMNTSGDGGWCELKSVNNYSFGVVMESYIQLNTDSNEYSGFGITNSGFESGGDFGDDGMYLYSYWAPSYSIEDKQFNTRKNASSTYIDISFDFGTWYKSKMFSTGNKSQLWLNDSLTADQTNSTYCPDPSETGKLWLGVHSYGSTLSPQLSADWVRVRKYASPEPTAGTFGAEETGGGASWKADEDTAVTTDKNVNVRVRFLVKNSVGEANYNYRLQWAERGSYANCASVSSTVFQDVSTTTGQAVIMATSTWLDDQATTTYVSGGLTDPPSYTWVSGKMVESPSNQTDPITLGANSFTENEYVFKFTDNAPTATTTYCFRLRNDGTADLDSYAQVAEITKTGVAGGVTISGTVYTDEGSTPMGSGRTVRIKVNGAGDYSTTTDASGNYSISGVTINAVDDVITVFLDSGTYTEKANTITLASSTSNNITGLDLYQNRVIVRHEGATTINISHLDQYDSEQDSDILYTASSTAGTLTASSTSELYVWSGKTFGSWGAGGVGGTISLADVDINGTFTATSTQIISVSGNWDATGGTFNSASSTVKFTSTATGKTITTGGTTNPFWNLEFNGSGGGWSFATGDHKVSNDFTVTQGTVTSTSGTLQVGGNWSNSGTFNHGSGTVTFNAASETKTINTGSSSPFNILIFDGGATWQLSTSTLDVDNNLDLTNGTLDAASQNITIAGNLTIASGFTFTKGTGTTTFDGSGTNTWTDNNATKQDMGIVVIDGSAKTINLGLDIKATKLIIGSDDAFGPGSYTFTITGSGTGDSRPFLINSGGTFSASTSLAEYIGATTTDIESTVYYNLKLNQADTIFQLYGNVTTTNDINNTTGTLDVTTNNYNLVIGGNWTNSGTFTARQGTVTFNATSLDKTITTGGTGNPFYNLIFNGSGGGWTFASGDHDVNNNFTITQGTVTSTAGTLYVGGNWLVESGGTFNANSGTVVFDAGTTGKTINPGSSPFNIVIFDNANGGWTITADATSTNNWQITNATSFVATSSITIEVQGNYIIGDSIPSVTTWNSGSVLYLNSGSSYTVGSKNQAAETYATLKIGANTDIRMWNSTATAYTVDSTGSLYSQDHNNSNGLLYVWGDYHTTSTDYWSYNTDFDGTDISGSSRPCQVTINATTSITVDSGAALEIKGGGQTSGDITTVTYAPASGSWDLNNDSGSELVFEEATIEYMKVNSGTVTVLNVTLNNEAVPTSGAILNADWYLGVHAVMVDSTSTPVATGTCTIYSTSTADATVWKWSGSGWGTASTTQNTTTTASGYIPQPGSEGAVRIREYSKTSSATTTYEYNLEITNAAGFSDYSYDPDVGHYITSIWSTESTSTVDKCISENWQRDDIDTNNQELTINEPPDWGTWYVGLNSDLEFGLSSLTVDLGILDAGNNYTATATTILYVTTTAPNGYLITAKDFAGNDGKLTTSTYSIIRWPYNNDSPALWSGNCVSDSQCGFGYTTDDNDLAGGTVNRFATSTKYAGFTSSTEEVADRGSGSWYGEQNTITYKVSVSDTQQPATYNTTIEYICTAQY